MMYCKLVSHFKKIATKSEHKSDQRSKVIPNHQNLEKSVIKKLHKVISDYVLYLTKYSNFNLSSKYATF